MTYGDRLFKKSSCCEAWGHKGASLDDGDDKDDELGNGDCNT